jgi:hypothetical protein
MSDGEGMSGGGAMEQLNPRKRTEKGDQHKHEKDSEKSEKHKQADEPWKKEVRDVEKKADDALKPVGPQLKQIEGITRLVAVGMETVAEKTHVKDLAEQVIKKATEVAIGDAVKSPEADKKDEVKTKGDDRSKAEVQEKEKAKSHKKTFSGRKRH